MSTEQIPPEPPNGWAVGGIGTDVWLREDDENVPGVGHWFGAGVEQVYTWAEAFADGADPNRRMVVVDPTDDELVSRLGRAIAAHDLTNGVGYRTAARAVLGALAEVAPEVSQ